MLHQPWPAGRAVGLGPGWQRLGTRPAPFKTPAEAGAGPRWVPPTWGEGGGAAGTTHSRPVRPSPPGTTRRAPCRLNPGTGPGDRWPGGPRRQPVCPVRPSEPEQAIGRPLSGAAILAPSPGLAIERAAPGRERLANRAVSPAQRILPRCHARREGGPRATFQYPGVRHARAVIIAPRAPRSRNYTRVPFRKAPPLGVRGIQTKKLKSRRWQR